MAMGMVGIKNVTNVVNLKSSLTRVLSGYYSSHVVSKPEFNEFANVNQDFKYSTSNAGFKKSIGNGPTSELSNNKINESSKLMYSSVKEATNNTLQSKSDQLLNLSNNKSGSTSDGSDGSEKANPTQLLHVYNVLSTDLPNLFAQPMDFSIYHRDLVFENHLRGTTTVGLFEYLKQLRMLRVIGHFKYAYVKLNVIKITRHSEDSTIKVRWRICGISGWKILTKLFRVKTVLNDEEDWYNGFSIFYVNSDGLVYKHIVSKMMPDESGKVAVDPKSPLSSDPIAPKLAFILAPLVTNPGIF